MKNSDLCGLVSVIVPTYNGEKYLEETLLSVFSQTYGKYEVIVIDDGSVTDDVKNICGKYKKRLKYIRQDNKGLSAARNAGIRNSSGEYIAFLDDDDIWHSEKLEKQVGYYEQLKTRGIKAGLIYTGVQECGEDGSFMYNVLWKSSGRNYDKLVYVDFVSYGGSTVMLKSSVLEDVGYFDEKLSCSEDYDLWLRIAKKYPIYSLDEFLVKFRNRRRSLSKDPDEMINAGNIILEKVFSDGDAGVVNGGIKERAIKNHKYYYALRWKNAAYDRLFIGMDGAAFRDCIMKGYSMDRSLFGFKVLIYYVLSYVSPSLCKYIKDLKKDAHKDVIMDVSDLRCDLAHE
jgi:glycosyltransferase involved in cell wall biosynthesis